jgi:hypothetical protein
MIESATKSYHNGGQRRAYKEHNDRLAGEDRMMFPHILPKTQKCSEMLRRYAALNETALTPEYDEDDWEPEL